MKSLIAAVLLFSLTMMLFFQDVRSAAAQRGAKYSLAVLNLNSEATDFTRTETAMFTDRLTRALAHSGYFYTMAQTQMESTLQRKNLDPHGCFDARCAIEAGDALGVQVVVIGQVEQTAEGYLVQVRLLHIASGVQVKEVREEVTGDGEAVYDRMPVVANRLMGKRTTAPVARAAPPATSAATAPPAPTRDVPVPVPAATPVVYDEDEGGGFKWYYVGLGVLVAAGGIGAGLLLSGSDDDPGTTGPGTSTPLPGPPSFP